MRIWLVIRLFSLALLTTLVACGGQDSPSMPIDSAAPASTLRVAFAEPVGVLDPHAFTGHFMALDMVYEPLVRYGEGGELLPALAETWEISPEGTEVTFHLRSGVTFHDGTAFDAETAKWNLERWVGEDDFSFLQASLLIKDIATPNKHTLILKLSRPYGPLLGELALTRPVRFMSPSSVNDEGKFQEPVGTGAWKFLSASDTTGVFVINEEYWGTKPDFQRVEIKLIPDSQTRLSALRSGEVDILGGGYLAPLSAIEADTLRDNQGFSVYSGLADTTLLLGFNPHRALVDQAVREAVSLAIDTEAISAVLYGEASVVARGLFPPSIPYATVSGSPLYDLAAAQEVFDEAGWTLEGNRRSRDGQVLSLKMLLIGDAAHGQGDSRNAGQVIADSLGRIGVTVNIDSMDGPAYFDALMAGDYDLAFFNTYGTPYDPSGTLAGFFTKNGGEAPIWQDEELEQLAEEALSAIGDDEITSAYRSVFEYLDQIIGFIPITHPPRYYAIGPRINDFVVPPSEYEFPWRGLSLTP